MSLKKEPDAPPLFQPGFHDLTPEEIKARLVEPFAGKRREKLLASFYGFLAWTTQQFGLPYVAWVDGSFCTEKEEPGDVDVAIGFKTQDLARLSQPQSQMLNYFASPQGHNILRSRYGCDSYFFPIDDPQWESYWADKFGNSNEHPQTGIRTPKGIVRIIAQ